MSQESLPYPIIVLTAPSGAGKTTIAHRILSAFPQMRFSVSATTRPPRNGERDGVDYHFVTEEQFRQYIANGDLIEYEEVYPGRFNGTLRSEVETGIREAPVLLDIDVKGALNIERMFGERSLTIFIAPPSLEVLAERLQKRNTETPETLAARLDRARMELGTRDQFDMVIVNDDLERASTEAIQAVQDFLHKDRHHDGP